MDRTKLRPAELAAGIGGLIVLIGLLFLKWYSYGADIDTPLGDFSASVGAWDGAGFFGTIANLVIAAAGIVAVGLAVVKMASKSVSLPVAASALTAAGGFAATAFIVLRIIFKPGEGGSLKFGIFVALVGAVIQAVAGWKAMQEEGTSFGEARDQLSGSMGSTGSGAAPPPSASPPPSSGEPSSGESSGGSEGGTPPPPPPPPGGGSAA